MTSCLRISTYLLCMMTNKMGYFRYHTSLYLFYYSLFVIVVKTLNCAQKNYTVKNAKTICVVLYTTDYSYVYRLQLLDANIYDLIISSIFAELCRGLPSRYHKMLLTNNAKFCLLLVIFQQFICVGKRGRGKTALMHIKILMVWLPEDIL